MRPVIRTPFLPRARTIALDYRIYGVRLRADAPIPGLTEASDTGQADVFVYFLGQAQPAFPVPEDASWVLRSRQEDPCGPAYEEWSATSDEGLYRRIRFTEGAAASAFTIAPKGDRIWISCTSSVTAEECSAVLLGPALGHALRARGVTCLHASAFVVNGRAIALIGHKGTGKSTTLTGLLRRGYPVLTDDIAALAEVESADGGNAFFVQPGHTRVRLLPDAAMAVLGTSDTLQPLWTPAPNRVDKRYLDLDEVGQKRADVPAPLAAIYVLQPRSRQIGAPSVTPLPSAEALLSLVPHTYANSLTDVAGRAREFQALSRLTASVPIRRLHRPDDLARLSEVFDALLGDVGTLTADTPVPVPSALRLTHA